MLRKAFKEKPAEAGRVELLGRVLHTVRRGIVAKAMIEPRMGRSVFDQRKKRVGNIADIFGPAKTPYVLIKPATGMSQKDQSDLIGSNVFMEGKHGRGQAR